MSSILTNTGAMVALQSLKSINKGLGETQSMISTGKKVDNAKDNGAVWAISKVMESDVVGFEKISEGLSVGEATVSVARNAAETTTDLLLKMKEKITQAQDPSQANNLTKIQADITGFRDQIASVVNAAQFNGVNLVSSANDIDVLSSLDRTGSDVKISNITVQGQDLSSGGYVAKTVFTGPAANVSTAGDAVALSVDNGADATLELDTSAMVEGDSISISIGDKTVTHTLSASDIAATSRDTAVVNALRTKIEGMGIGVTADVDSAAPGNLVLSNDSGAALFSVSGQFKNAGSGGLAELASIDVTSDLEGAMAAVTSALTTATDAAAAFGTAQNRIESQNEFVGKLTDSLKQGMGALVDADMEEVSARLQALQTQQQLGVQALSIASQAPQSILSLFR